MGSAKVSLLVLHFNASTVNNICCETQRKFSNIGKKIFVFWSCYSLPHKIQNEIGGSYGGVSFNLKYTDYFNLG